MIYSIPVYSQDGKKVTSWNLDENVFNDDVVNTSLISEYVRLQRNNGRIAIANTKNRADVAGSGKKMYKQKWMGTGRAGEKRSPLRRKWGVAFGPTSERNFTIKMNKKAKKRALAGLITLKAKSDSLVGIEALKYKDIKTKDAVQTLDNLQLKNEKMLLVLPTLEVQITKSFRNIPRVKYVLVENVSPYDVASHKKIVFVATALEMLTKSLAL